MRAPAAALAAIVLLLLPTLVPAQAPESEAHNLNVNNPLVRPGGDTTITVWGMPGTVVVTLSRLEDVGAVRGFTNRSDLGELERVARRDVRITADPASGGSWGTGTTTFTLERGIYLIESERGSTKQRAYVQAADHTFLVKAGREDGVVWAFRVDDGEPLANARVLVNGTEMGRTGAQGTLPVPARELDGPVFVIAPDGAPAAADLAWGGYHWCCFDMAFAPSQSRVLVHLDRPIYRPGQDVHYKVVTLEPEGDRMVPVTDQPVRVRVTTYARDGEEVVHEAVLEPNEYGSVADSFATRDDAPLGYYNVQVTTGDGAQGWASFEVQEYQKPRVKVAVEPQRDTYVRGDTVVVRASAEWFFGSPLDRGSVSYVVSEQPYWGDPCPYCRFSSMSLYPPYYGDSTPIASGHGALASDGSFTFSFTPKERDEPRELLVSVDITAESGERQTSTARVLVRPSEYSVQLVTDAWSYQKGDPIEAVATVTDLAERPVEGANVRFRLLQEQGGASREAEAVTDAQGRATARLDAPAGGSFTLYATTEDDEGREARDMRWLWSSDEKVAWYGGGALVVPDKERYAPGETMRVAIASPKPRTFLVSLEGSDLYEWRVVRIDGSATLTFPVRADQAPGFSVQAFAFDGLQAEAWPATVHGQADIQVAPDPRELNVTVTPDRASYRDGEDARLLVEVRDSKGAPVVGEIALGVVDESIYALREEWIPPLLQQLYPRAYEVRTTYAWQSVGGVRWDWDSGLITPRFATMEALDTAFAMGAPASNASAIGGRAVASEVRVREEFPDTALWLPFLETDERGLARVQLAAPDTLTEWRATARVHTLDGMVGEARGSFHTRKPLMVEMAPPRFLVQGDELSLAVVLFNEMGELRDIDVQLLVEGAAEARGTTARRVTLSGGDSVRLDFPLAATENGTLANLTVVAHAAGEPAESDAMRMRIPVLAHGVVEKAAQAGIDDATIRIPVPAGPYAAPPRVNVTLAPSMAAAVLDSLPYLLGFPYGCVEQTMSRFMPAVVATRALEDAGYDAEDPNLPQYVEQGLERLARFQHADGGWGWWEGDATHPYMTAYVVAGLAQAKRAGVDVDDKMLRDGVAALQKLVTNTKEPDMQAYQAYAIALAGATPRAWPDVDDLSDDGLALYGLAKLELGDEAAARRALDDLMEHAERSSGRLSWSDEGRGWGAHGIRSDVQLTAHAVRLLVGLGHDEDAARAVAWLAEQRRGAWWHTTKDTAESVLAVVEYVSGSDELHPDMEITVRVGDDERTFSFEGDASSLDRRSFELPVPADAFGRALEVEFEKEGEGRLYWSATVTSTPRAQDIRARSDGFTVERSIVDAKGASVRSLKFGEEYTVVLRVAAPAERQFVLLHDPLPAGAQFVRQADTTCWDCRYYGYGGYWTNVEARDDHVAAFATSLPAGETELRYTIRAAIPGSYHALPATVEEMYRPDVRGRSAEAHLTVGDVPRILLGAATVVEDAVRVRVVPAGGSVLRIEALNVSLTDGDGFIVPARTNLVPLDDGSVDVELEATGELPEVILVTVAAPGAAPAVRRLDTVAAPLPVAINFGSAHEDAWASGAVFTAMRQEGSPRLDPALFPVQQPPEPQPVQPGPDAPSDPTPDPPPIPGAGGLLVAVAVAALAIALRKTRGHG